MTRCWKLGDNVATDELLPFQYMTLTTPSELGHHVLENVRPGFVEQLAPGDILICGTNFGCGSSREHAPLALKGAGVGAIIAKSYARIFFRNCINIGLPAVVCPSAVNEIQEGESAALNLAAGGIEVQSGKTFTFDPFPPFLLEYLLNGGLINYLNKRQATYNGLTGEEQVPSRSSFNG
ncbi:MAG: 3-isopropylmalate dehydratase small subunit [Synergistaceae bacterium]|jgi:3-isopropylmalate/(R)-2-methylmalate dehydratase small subunit|nr:3-isopropylmalate dehydratase small subunit [Synergistaceae bacterium]